MVFIVHERARSLGIQIVGGFGLLEECAKGLPVECLHFHQRVGYLHELFLVVGEHARSPIMGLLDQAFDFTVDLLRHGFTVIALLLDVAAQEDQLFLAAKRPRPSFSLMPYSMTMRRARLVAISMSFEAPVVISPNTNTSAA